jgi:hypothetical protein
MAERSRRLALPGIAAGFPTPLKTAPGSRDRGLAKPEAAEVVGRRWRYAGDQSVCPKLAAVPDDFVGRRNHSRSAVVNPVARVFCGLVMAGSK